VAAGVADAVFVGAGIDTLGAALLLAEAGWRVAGPLW
jgi:phytoene dehydrogenase-like protein